MATSGVMTRQKIIDILKAKGVKNITRLKLDELKKKLEEVNAEKVPVKENGVEKEGKIVEDSKGGTPVKVLSSGVEKVTHIVHISDVHIRPLKRHEEYKYIFEELYESVRKVRGKILMVITGDLLHEKDHLTPENILLIRDYLINKMNTICVATIIIPGNHDIIERNYDRQENLQAVLHELKNTIYINETGVFQYNNIFFCHTSRKEKDVLTFAMTQAMTGENAGTSIALYHGMVQAPEVLSFSHYMPEDAFSIDDFKGYDCVLLGDIHKHQYLSPVCAYAGSLIEQTFGEIDYPHGYILWDVSGGGGECKSTFIEIQSQYGHVVVNVTDGAKGEYTCVPPSAARMPQKPYIRYLINSSVTETELDVIRKKIETGRDVQSMEIRIKTGGKKEAGVEGVGGTKVPTSSPEEDDTEVLKSTIQDICGDSTPLSEDGVSFIVSLHKDNVLRLKETNTGVAVSQYWYPLEIEFMNVLSYGNNQINKVSFKKGGTYTITGKNAIGKTNILKLFMFALFEKFSSARNRSCILNKQAKYGHVTLDIMYGTKTYRIKRSFKSKIIHKKALLEFNTEFSLIKDNDKGKDEKGGDGGVVSLTQEQNKKTSQEIEALLGITYEDFLLTNVYSNTYNNSFTVLSGHDILSSTFEKYFRLSDYEKIHKMAKEAFVSINDEVSFLKGKISSLRHTDDETLTKIKAEIEEIQEKLRIEKNKTKTGIRYVGIDYEGGEGGEGEGVEEIQKRLKEYEYPGCEKDGMDGLLMRELEFWKSFRVEKPTCTPLDQERIALLMTSVSKEEYRILFYNKIHSGHIDGAWDIEGVKDEDAIKYIEEQITITTDTMIAIKNEADKNGREGIPIKIEKDEDGEYRENKINEYIDEYSGIRTEIASLQTDINVLRMLLSSKTQTLKSIHTITHSSSSTTEDIEDTHDKLYKELSIVGEGGDERRGVIVPIELYKRLLVFLSDPSIFIYTSLDSIYSQYEQTMDRKKEILEMKRKRCAKLDKYIDMYYSKKYLDMLIKNAEYQDKLAHVLVSIRNSMVYWIQKKLMYHKMVHQLAYQDNVSNISALTVQINTLEDRIKRCVEANDALLKGKKSIGDKEKILGLHKTYLACVNKSGLPLHLLMKKINEITKHTNIILSNFVKFRIEFSTESDKLSIQILKNGVILLPVDLSGYETFILNIALKISLYTIGTLSKCSIFFIDEGLDCIDTENFQLLPGLIDFIKEHYRNIVLISHINEVSVLQDHNISIVSDGISSRIQ